jgi:hypothetical protein
VCLCSYTYLGSVAGDLSDIIRGQAATLNLTTQIIIWVISGVIILTVKLQYFSFFSNYQINLFALYFLFCLKTVIILTIIAKRAINKMMNEQNAAQESNIESNIRMNF